MTDIVLPFASFVAGVVYPTYQSFKAIKSPSKEDDVQWLSYWVIYSLYSMLDFFLGWLLKSIPMFVLFEFLAILYLVLPGTQGALALFLKVEEPLTRYVAKIDDLAAKHLSNLSAHKPAVTSSGEKKAE